MKVRWGEKEGEKRKKKEYKTHKKYIISVLISICLCRSVASEVECDFFTYFFLFLSSPS
jgi:hypothetical protein